jgi:hypothetical protein
VEVGQYVGEGGIPVRRSTAGILAFVSNKGRKEEGSQTYPGLGAAFIVMVLPTR